MTTTTPQPTTDAKKAAALNATANTLLSTLKELPLVKGHPMPCAGCDAVFRAETLLRCKECKCVAYCSQHCQRAHWPAHQFACHEPTVDMRTKRTEKFVANGKLAFAEHVQLQALLISYEELRREVLLGMDSLRSKQLVFSFIVQRNGCRMVAMRMADLQDCKDKDTVEQFTHQINDARAKKELPFCIEAMPFQLNDRFAVIRMNISEPEGQVSDARTQLKRLARGLVLSLVSSSEAAAASTTAKLPPGAASLPTSSPACMVMKQLPATQLLPGQRIAFFDNPMFSTRPLVCNLFVQGGDPTSMPDQVKDKLYREEPKKAQSDVAAAAAVAAALQHAS